MENKDELNQQEIDLCGHTVKIVQTGLDKEQVATIVKDLTSERDALLKRQENLASLTRLYENTVIEAGELAKQIEKETRDKVQKEANTILTQAHERAKVMVEQQQNEARQLIQQRLKTIKNDVKQRLETLHKQEIDKLKSRIAKAAQSVSAEILAEEESLSKEGNLIEIELGDDMFDTAFSGEPEKTNEREEVPAVMKATPVNRPEAKPPNHVVTVTGKTVTEAPVN